MNSGTCSHFVKNDNDRTARGISLPYNHSCSYDWWNVAPSTGVVGQYCVAYNNRIHSHHCYLPLICAPLVAFPLYIGDAIPKRAVVYQGEVFFTKSVQIPDDLPSSGHLYFSAQPDIIAAVVVDDELAVLLDGTEFLTYDFSTSGFPHPAFVEMPRSIMERLAGRTITIEYRDVYSFFVSASTMWLIWVP
jgi:hypothetical protein